MQWGWTIGKNEDRGWDAQACMQDLSAQDWFGGQKDFCLSTLILLFLLQVPHILGLGSHYYTRSKISIAWYFPDTALLISVLTIQTQQWLTCIKCSMLSWLHLANVMSFSPHAKVGTIITTFLVNIVAW